MSYQVYLFFLIAGLVFVPCPQSQILETNKETIENLKSNDAICRRPKAILNTDIIKDTNSNHHQSFVILGADTNNYFGFGNKLIFSSGMLITNYRFITT